MGAPKKYHTDQERLEAKRQQKAASETKRRRAAGMAEKKVYATEEERKAAKKEWQRKHYEANKDKINADRKLSRAAQRERGEGRYSDYIANMTAERKAEYDERRKKYYVENKDSIRAGQRQAYLKKAEWYIWKNIKLRAEREGIPFDIEVSDIVVPEYCPILGIKLERLPGLKMRDIAPSVDRLIPDLGYVKGNIIVISFRANRIKNDASLDELKKITAFLEAKIESSGIALLRIMEKQGYANGG